MITPEQLRAITEEAIKRQEEEKEKELLRLKDKQAQQAKVDELRAQGIIMQIQPKCRKEAENGRSHAIVMSINQESDIYKGSASIVHQYCMDHRLNPKLERWDDGFGINSGYNIVVHW